ncbi:sensor histidine kinase [Leifsonia poae]|uniref:Histidine kinase n=1 Tax=Leifsonia poae TaxID=110933 RepID=A0A9W6H708_9MICO|nr:histidine kinase [Leifsonia poae]GLJ75094.1 histidine kinase [Leifsonia poae]
MDVVATEQPRRPSVLESRWETARARILNPQARGWYIGASFGLLYQVLTFIAVWSSAVSPAMKIVTSVLLLVFYAAFIVMAPLCWGAPRRTRILAVVLLWAGSLVFFFLMGSTAFWLSALVAVAAGAVFDEFALMAVATLVLVLPPIAYGIVTGFSDSAAFSAIVTFSVASMMFGLNRQLSTVRELRAAQVEVARLAVVEERARFSRDMHDVLGHSLTVVTVKSELAGRLVPIDPARAEAELADIERLSRAALADLRGAVAGYREMSLSTELAAAQAGLAAADIAAHLPRNGDSVDQGLRELFGWVLREGVTNVIRHSGARNCWVTVTADSLEIDDDGHGMAAVGAVGAERAPLVAAVSGSGLDGLTARAREVGARVLVGPSDRGGVRLTVRKGKA